MDEYRKIFEDFRKTLKDNPGAFFGILYPYIFIIIVGIGLFYLIKINEVAQQEIPAILPDTTIISTELEIVEAREIPPVDLSSIGNASEDMLQQGEEIYVKLCATCHNETGMGGGPGSIGLNPAPRNFTQPDGWKNGSSLSGIYTSLEEGIEGSSMISYDYLTPEVKVSLAHYIRNEFVTDPPEITGDELAVLDQLYNLSAGTSVPAQIPVASAMKLLSSESNEKLLKMENVIEKVEVDTDNNAILLNEVISDKNLAISSLLVSDEWQGSTGAFEKFISVNINQNGFNGRFFSLSDAEMNGLFNYLSKALM